MIHLITVISVFLLEVVRRSVSHSLLTPHMLKGKARTRCQVYDQTQSEWPLFIRRARASSRCFKNDTSLLALHCAVAGLIAVCICFVGNTYKTMCCNKDPNAFNSKYQPLSDNVASICNADFLSKGYFSTFLKIPSWTISSIYYGLNLMYRIDGMSL